MRDGRQHLPITEKLLRSSAKLTKSKSKSAIVWYCSLRSVLHFETTLILKYISVGNTLFSHFRNDRNAKKLRFLSHFKTNLLQFEINFLISVKRYGMNWIMNTELDIPNPRPKNLRHLTQNAFEPTKSESLPSFLILLKGANWDSSHKKEDG